MPLDRGTRIYAAFLLALILGLVLLALYEPPRVAELNDLLESDPQVSASPYPFRVLRVEGATAVMSTPRSPAVPVERVLGLLFPEVAGQPGDAPAFQAAQQRLARIQTRARDLVLEAPDIDHVRWELDRDWLMRHGIQPPPG
ncbi:MAG TPA: glutamate-ammonia-ligase adenylyltransferase [Sedimenticola sp.]|nr:glutamate-ammonia-ligase adenylyltransferase [Sedimenticola sp.]